ncbi:hypothetical protein CAPTEDRAFT_209358 [Capitella teleta]|uniref:Chitin-binding type-2 domain-containing protein n=1 Tax=Capitella teleta TaxID=283909 RepID=R7TLI2_CAPTE|nr:hypothetical protein CAPTEDRAFT_209358 [Capitella teleta]|eukprot:ELT94698.1 hypothetical protein CAPTEDRAFT_209358 [Capitella teleta]
MGTAKEFCLVFILKLICAFITTSSARNPNRGNEQGHPGVPQTFWGKFEGVCEGNGFYYADINNFVFCFHGNSYIMPCAPGTENPGYNSYADDVGRKKSDLEFCNVNLVASGYQDLELPRYGRRIENDYHPDNNNNYQSYQPSNNPPRNTNYLMPQTKRQVRYHQVRQGKESKSTGYSRRIEGKRANVGPYEPSSDSDFEQNFKLKDIQIPNGEDKVVIKIRQQRIGQNKINRPKVQQKRERQKPKREDNPGGKDVYKQEGSDRIEAPYNDPQREFKEIEIRFPSTIYDDVEYQSDEGSLVYTPGMIFDNELLKSPYLPRANVRSSGYRRLSKRDSMLAQSNGGP